MEFDDDQLRIVLRHVAPIEQYAIRIAEAHELGFGPGEYTDIWGLEFQRKAQKVWKESLPPLFLWRVAESYRRCARLMEVVLPEQSIAGDWGKIARYLGAVAEAIANDPDCAKQQVPSDASDIEDMPEVVHYEKLAELVHPRAAKELRATAAAVARFCRFNASNAPNETQLAFLQGLANGETHAALAKRLGYSERHLQRHLADMWLQFDVDNTMEGVAFAVAQGWVALEIEPRPQP